ncbi:MAG: c-type cytochrome, partial [Lutibacter sp.]
MKIKVILVALVMAVFASCGGNGKKEVKQDAVKESAKKEVKEAVKVNPMDDKGVGPITEKVTLGEIDPALAEKGHQIFKAKCTACHKIGKRYIGPALKGVTQRQSPEWIMNMILNPEKMIVENETAKE